MVFQRLIVRIEYWSCACTFQNVHNMLSTFMRTVSVRVVRFLMLGHNTASPWISRNMWSAIISFPFFLQHFSGYASARTLQRLHTGCVVCPVRFCTFLLVLSWERIWVFFQREILMRISFFCIVYWFNIGFST